MTEVAALDGLQVVELAEGISGPYCGWLMACCGANVVKVERPGGDYLRQMEPAAATGDSATFMAINSGKRSIVVGDDDADRAALAGLLVSADVVVVGEEDLPAGIPGWSWAARHLSDRAVICRTLAAGDGIEATELEVQAMSGLTRYLGAISEPPVRIGADLGQVLAGAFLFQGALAALLEREESGSGQVVTTTALGSLAAIGSVMIAAVDDPDGWEGFHCRAAAYTRDPGVKTATGPISFSSPRRSDDDWVKFCTELGADELARNPDYAHDSQRTPRSKELNRELSRYTAGIERQRVLEVAQRNGALAVPVQTQGEVFAHPQITAIDAVTTMDGGLRLAPPWRINGTRPHPHHGVPSVGGAHQPRGGVDD